MLGRSPPDLRHCRRRYDDGNGRQAIIREGPSPSQPAPTRDQARRGLAVAAVVEELRTKAKKVTSNDEIESAPSRPTATREIGARSPGHEEGRQRRRNHSRGSEQPGDRARRRGGHAVRPRLYLAPMPTPTRCWWSSRAVQSREEALHLQPMLPMLESVVQATSPADHRRGRRRRGAGHAGRNSCAVASRWRP